MADIDVERILGKLSVAEKVDLLAGIDFWHTKPLPEHGVPSLRFSDGPNGVRGTRFFNGIKAACFPCGTALGATFNKALLEEAGRKMGDEAKAKGAHVILGPTINMQRSPLGGRGFESLSEDPVLAGLGAAALLRGIQSTGVQAALKHFVCNDHEHRRNAVQCLVTERALREIYALPFQIAIKHANPASIMTAYNGVNGKFCSESPDLLEKLLRKEWGWNGLVMSDWYGTYTTTEAALAGLDLEMPGPPRFRGSLLRFNVNTGKVGQHILDERARAVLNLVKRCAPSNIPENAEEITANTDETAALLRRIAGESIVLLRNQDQVLPLKKDQKTLVIGPNAKIATYHGGGSAALASYYAVTPFDGISSALSSPPEYALGCYSHKLLPLLGLSVKAPSGEQGMRFRVFNEAPGTDGRQHIDELVLSNTEVNFVDYKNKELKERLWYAEFEAVLTPDEDCTWELSVIVCGTAKLFVDGELVVDNATKQTLGDTFFGVGTVEEKGRLECKKGQSYNIKVEFASGPSSTLPNTLLGHGAVRIGGYKVIDPQAEIERAAAMAATADQVIICAGLNADWEAEGVDRTSMDLPPPMDTLITAVAAANPRTVVVVQSGTPVRMPWLSSVAGLVQAWYGGNETGNAIADALFGDVNPSGKLSMSFPIKMQDNPAFLNYRTEGGRTLYGEDIYIGYRYYEFAEKEVLFPFGYGLSYTTFAFSGLNLAEHEGKLTVSVDVKNTGSTAGAEVVQVYVAPPARQATSINRPVKELQGFEKVELAPGESKQVVVEMETKYASSYFDESRNQWCVQQGEYEVIASNSSEAKDEQALKGKFTVAETFWWSGL